jgi:PAS domain S-box-containing protein
MHHDHDGGGDDPQNTSANDPMGSEPTEQHDRQSQPVDAEQSPRLGFPVVGIGASAGGLEAITEFVGVMRADSGMAFVFIQHLPPERESLMADILARKTRMPVAQVEDGMEVEPDHLYVIRPGNILTIKDGRFHLGPQLGKRGMNRPVDDFFKSLAEEQRERAIAIIFSGMGSNGTAGAQAIKAVGGLCIAQEPDTAQFPSMPRHLIDQGYADYVLRPTDIPDVLMQYAGHPYAREGRRDDEEQAKRQYGNIREILAILRTRTRQDFSGYKKPTILRRTQRRMGLTRVTDIGDYARLLRQHPSEVTALADDLLIHVTGFFRDAQSWETLRQRVIVPLVARREPDSELRAWVTACSSGEEAYTLAMLLVEETERAGKPLGIKVFATDMAERTLGHARTGIYPGGIESEIDPQRLEKFFDKEDATYRVKQFLRECVLFAPQNVLSDPPFSRLDIVSCRNLLIYLEPDVQQRVLNLLHFGLREGGALFLGSSETVAGLDEMYELVDKRSRIYRRVGPTRHGSLDFPLPHAFRNLSAGEGGGAGDGGEGAAARAAAEMRTFERRPTGRPSIAMLTQRTLLEQHVKAAVTVDRDNRVLYFHGNTRPFLEQPPGEPTRDMLVLAREGLRGSLRVALHRCAAEQKSVTVLDGWVEMSTGRHARVAVTASPVAMDDPMHPEYFVVSFDHLDELGGSGGGGASTAEAGNGDAGTARDELRRVRDELQTTIEELQTSNEELKASNEEVTSINEELQSSNEELETSKEEMQSLNEELTTLNAQLSAKMEEHQDASNDMTALLSSTAIAVLFLDANFRIRRYTPAVRELLDLIPGDVGRPLSDMRRKFEDPDLDADVRAVIASLVPVEREVDAANGRSYARRALPYRTVDNRIDGVVVTFTDVTDRKRVELEVNLAREYAESIVQTLHEPLLVLNNDLTVRSANPAFYRQFKVKEAETAGRKIYDLGNGQWDIPALRIALGEVLPANKVFTDREVIHDFEGIGRRVMLLNARQLDHVQLILLGIRDVTVEQEIEAALRESELRFRTLVQNIHDYAILMLDVRGVITEWTEGAKRVTGYSADEAIGKHVSLIYPADQVEAGRVDRELAEAAETGRAEREDWRLRKNGERFWGNEIVTAIRDDDGRVTGFAKITRDLGERRWIERALCESEERYRMIVENVRDYGIFTLDPHGTVTSWNPGAERIFKFTADEIVGQNGRIIFTPEDVATGQSEAELKTAAEQGRASDDRWQVRKGGERFWAAGVTTALRDAAGNLTGFTKILRDETQRKHLEEQLRTTNEALERRVADRTAAMETHQGQLRSLVAELGRAEIRQRRMLATELHDNLAQLLAACKLKVSSIEAQLPPHAKSRRDATVVKDSLGEAISYTRALMTDLRPDVLDEHDLPAAIEWVAKRMARHGLKVEVADDGKPKPLHEELLGFLFQSVRELLWNVVKHARTTEALVTIERTDSDVRLVVEDKGIGFNPSKRVAPTEEGGFGLFSIAERIDLLGGKMEVESGRRRGARITLSVPAEPEHEAHPDEAG